MFYPILPSVKIVFLADLVEYLFDDGLEVVFCHAPQLLGPQNRRLH